MNYNLISPRIPGASMIEQVLTNRGIADVEHYLNTSDNDIIPPNENTIHNLKAGAQMLIQHIAAGDKIFMQIDSDCDGYTSAAVLINYLNRLFPSFVQSNISYRVHADKSHGIRLETIPEGTKLVIAPDSSSNEYDTHMELKKHGIDVLIIDHHEAEYVSPYACVINNQLCPYPNKFLSGVGMVYKFCCYIDTMMNTDYAEDYLDLVALGMIADMMSLREYETKHLINLGINQIRNPYFKGMITKNAFSLGNKITPFGISFYVAPYVNAVTRVGTAEEKLTLFESMLDYKAYEMIPSTKRGCKGQMETRVEQAVRTCTNVKNRQTKARDVSAEVIEKLIKEQNLNENKILVVPIPAKYAVEKNLTGLVANEIAADYQKPVLILNETETAWVGSGRNYDQCDFKNFRQYLAESGYFNFAEGHEGAFGASIDKDKLAEFLAKANEELAGFDFTPKYNVDFEYDMITLNGEDILNLAEFSGLWGQEVNEPYVLIKNVKLTTGNTHLLKGTTFKISTNTDVNFIKFGFNEEEFNRLVNDMGCTTINIIGHFQKNEWNGYINPQIQIVDYEIVKQMAYYF